MNIYHCNLGWIWIVNVVSFKFEIQLLFPDTLHSDENNLEGERRDRDLYSCQTQSFEPVTRTTHSHFTCTDMLSAGSLVDAMGINSVKIDYAFIQ